MDVSHLITHIGSGHSAEVFRLAGGLVIKLFRAEVGRALIAREFDGAHCAHAAGLPVPRPVGWETVDGRIGIIFEELSGRPLINRRWTWRLDRLRAGLDKLACCHVQIHRCDATNLPHRQHALLRVRIERADVDEPLRDRALAELEALAEGDRLCHGDLHPGNVIRVGDSVAPVDWANASAGDPAADVVRTEILLRYGRYGAALRKIPPLRLSRALAARHYLRGYLARTAISAAHLARWWLPVAVSCLIRPSHIDRQALLADRRFRQDVDALPLKKSQSRSKSKP